MTRSDCPVSAIICAHNFDRWHDIQEAIASLEAQTLPPLEIVLVVDNNEALLQRCVEHFPHIRVVANSLGSGNSGARNTALALTSAPLIALLDDDAAAHPRWLETLVPYFADPLVLGAGGPIVPLWIESRPRWLPEEFLWTVGCTFAGYGTGSNSVRSLISAGVVLRREPLVAVGGFSADFGRSRGKLDGSGEETDACVRISKAFPGGRFLFVPEAAAVRHKVARGRTTIRYFMRRSYIEGACKARLARAHDNVLGTERRFVARNVFPGIFRNLFAGTSGGGGGGTGRACMMLGGLAAAAVGYCAEMVAGLRERQRG